MKLHKITTLASVLFLSLVLLSPAQARSGHKGHHDKGGHFKKMMQQLNLTEEQQSQVKSIFEDFRESHKDQRKQIRAERQAMNDLMRQEALDETLLRKQMRKMSEMREDMMIERIKMMKQVRSLLTDEQKARLDELKQQWREKHEKRRAKMQSQDS